MSARRLVYVAKKCEEASWHVSILKYLMGRMIKLVGGSWHGRVEETRARRIVAITPVW